MYLLVIYILMIIKAKHLGWVGGKVCFGIWDHRFDFIDTQQDFSKQIYKVALGLSVSQSFKY